MRKIFLTLIATLGLQAACMNTGSGLFDVGSTKPLIISNPTLDEFRAVYGQNCEKLNLTQMSEKLKSFFATPFTTSGCDVVGKALAKTYAIVVPETKSDTCKIVKGSGPSTEPVRLEISGEETCRYAVGVGIGLEDTSGNIKFFMVGGDNLKPRSSGSSGTFRYFMNLNYVVTASGEGVGFGTKSEQSTMIEDFITRFWTASSAPSAAPDAGASNSFTVEIKNGVYDLGTVSGGLVSGTSQPLQCDKTSGTCKGTYPKGSQLKFAMPDEIVVGNTRKFYQGKVTCNGQEQPRAASNRQVELEITNLSENKSCEILFGTTKQ